MALWLEKLRNLPGVQRKRTEQAWDGNSSKPLKKTFPHWQCMTKLEKLTTTIFFLTHCYSVLKVLARDVLKYAVSAEKLMAHNHVKLLKLLMGAENNQLHTKNPKNMKYEVWNISLHRSKIWTSSQNWRWNTKISGGSFITGFKWVGIVLGFSVRVGRSIPIITEHNLQSVFLWIYWEVTLPKVFLPTEIHFIHWMNTEWDISDSFRKVEPFVTGKHCRFLGRNRIFEDIPRTKPGCPSVTAYESVWKGLREFSFGFRKQQDNGFSTPHKSLPSLKPRSHPLSTSELWRIRTSQDYTWRFLCPPWWQSGLTQ